MPDEMLEQRIRTLNASEGTDPVMAEDLDKRTYSVEDVQRILDISRSTAYQLIKKKCGYPFT